MYNDLFSALGDRLVNVASVPQRSPFRYPGGKTWLVPYVRLWLFSITPPPRELIEPFAGDSGGHYGPCP
jgi:DNA adenine methylase